MTCPCMNSSTSVVWSFSNGIFLNQFQDLAYTIICGIYGFMKCVAVDISAGIATGLTLKTVIYVIVR